MKDNEAIVIRLEGVYGSPLVSGICIRKAPRVSGDLIAFLLLALLFSGT